MGSRPRRRRRCGAVNAVLTTDRFRKRQLGIALGERSLSVAEAVSTGGGAMRVERCAEFAYPSGLTLERGEELGNALAQFLRSKGFSTRRAILGIPAKWLMIKSHTLPPADAALSRSLDARHRL